MRFSTVLIYALASLLFAASVPMALQVGSGSFTWANVSSSSPYDIITALNITGPVKLEIIPASQFYSYENGGSVSPVYSEIVGSSGIYDIPSNAGSYSVILTPENGAAGIAFYAFGAPKNAGKIIRINNTYSDSFSISNYSKTNLTVASLENVKFEVGGYSGTLGMTNTSMLFYLDRGNYTLRLSTSGSDEAYVGLLNTPSLVNPFSTQNFSEPYPAGMVSYGLYNVSGTLVPYTVKTDVIGGYANITSISAYDPSPPPETSRYGASLQLNAVLHIVSPHGAYDYWLQNVLDVDTENHSYYIADNIWNYTYENNGLYNGSLSGNGMLYNNNLTAGGKLSGRNFYGYGTETGSYRLPIKFAPVIRVGVNEGRPYAAFGYYTSKGIYYYDNVTINVSAESAYLLVTPYYGTNLKNNNLNYYDAEFVFGGEGEGAYAYFNSIAANLSLYYYNSTGAMVAFPSVFTFGSDTAEDAGNIAILKYGNHAHASAGRDNPLNDFILSGTLPDIANGVSNSTGLETLNATLFPTAANPIGNIKGNITAGVSNLLGLLNRYGISRSDVLFILELLIALLFLFVLYEIIRRFAETKG